MNCRMTLDEAIAHARAEAELQRKYAKEIREKTREAYLDYGEAEEQCAEYHEKLAEWLEELKILKSLKNCSFITIGKTVEQFEQEIRNKAIDDFAEKIIRYVDCGHLCSPTEIRYSDLAVVEMVKKIEEQLKVGDGE